MEPDCTCMHSSMRWQTECVAPVQILMLSRNPPKTAEQPAGKRRMSPGCRKCEGWQSTTLLLCG